MRWLYTLWIALTSDFPSKSPQLPATAKKSAPLLDEHSSTLSTLECERETTVLRLIERIPNAAFIGVDVIGDPVVEWGNQPGRTKVTLTLRLGEAEVSVPGSMHPPFKVKSEYFPPVKMAREDALMRAGIAACRAALEAAE